MFSSFSCYFPINTLDLVWYISCYHPLDITIIVDSYIKDVARRVQREWIFLLCELSDANSMRWATSAHCVSLYLHEILMSINKTKHTKQADIFPHEMDHFVIYLRDKDQNQQWGITRESWTPYCTHYLIIHMLISIQYEIKIQEFHHT